MIRFRCLPPDVTVDELVAARSNVFADELPTPTLLLRESAVEHNIATMASYCAGYGVELAPHGKTTMAPRLFARQLEAGAWGISAATPAQVRIALDAGARRILLANQLVDARAARWIAAEMAADGELEVLCLVDSVDGVRLLEAALAGPVRPLPVLVELGVLGGRAGCRGIDELLVVAHAAAASPRLALAGVAAYEGAAPDLAAVEQFLAELRAAAEAVAGLVECDPPIVSAGGSAYFDIVVATLADLPARVVLRAGAYVAHDHGVYARLSPFSRAPGRRALRPALEAWGRVLSRPEPGLAVLDAGRRDVPDDQGAPIPFAIRRSEGPLEPAVGLRVSGLHDQHALLELPAPSPLAVGDWVGMGISHPCTAFDKWNLLLMVDDEYTVVDGIRTCF